MAKNKKIKKKQARDGNKSLSLLLYANDPSQFKLVEDILAKSADKLSTELELLLINASGQDPSLSELNENLQNKIIVIEPTENSTKGEAILEGVNRSSHGIIALIDLKYLDSSFNIGELLIRGTNKNEYFSQVIFKENTNDTILKGIAYSPFIIVKKNILIELLKNVSSKNFFWDELFKLAGNYNFSVSYTEFNQVSPINPVPCTKGIKKIGFKWIFLFNWLIKIPYNDIKNKEYKSKFLNYPSWYRLAFTAVAILLFFLMPILSLDAGISGDEEVNYRHAGYVLDYYATMGEDTTSLFTPVTQLQYYGQAFDNFTALFNRAFDVELEMEWRHVFNALVGWLTLIIAALLAVRVAGWRAGLFTMLLLFFSPRFLGHSFNNPKDIPFALGYIFSIYYFILFLKRFPKPGKKTIFLALLGVALAISIRIGGLLLIAFLFLFSGIFFLVTSPKKEFLGKYNINRLGKLITYLFIISLGGYFLGLLFWPYALQDPIGNPLEALDLMTNFSASLRQLFAGKVIWSDRLPWYYLSKYIVISVPIIVLVGVVLSFFFFTRIKGRLNYLWMFFILFAFVFPVAYIINKESNVYGGWRHVLFIYPPMVIAASIGYEGITRALKNKYIKLAALLCVLFLAYHPVKHIIKNHPLEYIYYNQLVGGVKGAYSNYEMDYYYHGVRSATEWLLNHLEENDLNEDIILATNFAHTVKYYTRNYDNIKVVYIRYYDRGNSDWDYAILANSYINPYHLKRNTWPPKNTIHRVEVDDVPVGAVVERKDKSDFLGHQALQNRNYKLAEKKLKEALALDPNNEAAALNLTTVYVQTNQHDKAIAQANKLLKVYPNYDKALNLLGIAYMNKNQLDNALAVFNRITEVNPKFVSSYYNMGLVYARRNNAKQALNYFNKAIEVNRRFKPAYLAAASVLRNQGQTEQARRYMEAANSL
jgi:tetratricopeptide (TPR) repeat protein